jgi:hypothetical protein
LTLESYNFADDVVKMPQKVNPISFIDGKITSLQLDNGRFVKYSHTQDKTIDQKPDIQSWDMKNLNLARVIITLYLF